jgi:hypothetical protein
VEDSVALHIFRAHAAGFFEGLDGDTRARLLADVDAHDAMRAAFTREGTLTYDRTLKAFRFRYEVRVQAESLEEARDEMAETVRARAIADLARLGVRHDPASLRVGGTDMASVWRR